MLPKFFQCGTIEENMEQKHNQNQERLRTGSTYNAKCPSSEHLVMNNSFYSGDTGCYMLIKSYPQNDGRVAENGFESLFHAEATCRRWHPDAHVLEIDDYREFLLVNDLLTKAVKDDLDRNKYLFLLKNTLRDGSITIFCKDGKLVRQRKQKISQRYDPKLKHTVTRDVAKVREEKCLMARLSESKVKGEYVFDGIGATSQFLCKEALGLICEYTPDCPVKMKIKPAAVPRSEMKGKSCQLRSWPQFRSQRRTLKEILEENGFAAHYLI